MSYDAILAGLFIVLILMFAFMIYRSRNAPKANERIVRSNEQVIENQRRLIDLQERNAVAMERIANALEKR